MTVAETILAQLGGRNRLTIVTGATNYSTNGNDLTFRLPDGFARNRINCVRIILDDQDLYQLEFLNVRGIVVKLISTARHVGVAELAAAFGQYTGLYLSLGTGGVK